jgi:hypothetical protein
MGLWVRHSKELETGAPLLHLTAIVAQQSVADVFADEKPQKAKSQPTPRRKSNKEGGLRHGNPKDPHTKQED